MANAWFRMYAEFATDPKVQMLTETDQRRYIMLLCLRCSNGDVTVNVTLQDEFVAFQLRISNDEWAQTKQRLIEKKLIDKNAKPTAWDKRQFVSDSSAARVARHRNKAVTAKKRACNVTVTPPDTDTDTDTNTTPPISPPPSASAVEKPPTAKRTRAVAQPPDGVTAGVWADFLALRKAKHAPVTATALATIEQEAVKARVSLQTALETCCARGWQGFRAEWYTAPPAGRAAESFRERDQRIAAKRVAEFAPAIADRQALGAPIFDLEASNVAVIEGH